MTAIPQVSFTSGELAPSLYGRIDFSRYHSGLKICHNFIVRPFGGVANRPGTEFISEVQNSAYRHRLIPFQFSTLQTYVLVFGHLTMRVIKDGGVVLYPVGHPSAGNPVEIVTIYPASVLPRLTFTQSADTMTICHPDYPPQQLTRTDHHLWTFGAFNNVLGPFLEINTDTAKTVYASAVSGSVTITAATSIFTADMVGQMLYIEEAPNARTRKWEVAKSVTVNDIKRAGSNYYQALTTATTGTVRPDHDEGVAQDGDPGVAWNYLHSGFGIVLISGYSSGTSITGTVLKRLPDTVVTGSQQRNVSGVTGYDPNETPGSGDEYVHVTVAAHGFSTGDSVTFANVGGATVLNGVQTVEVVDANTLKVNVELNDAYTSGGTATKTLTAINTYKWALEAWGGAQKYPGTTSYFQQRQIFGGSYGQPQTTWMSRTAGYLDFGESNPILADDAITFTIAANEVNEIRHLIELNELIVLTSNGPWMVRGSQDGVITPSAISIKRQGFGGSSYVPPVIVGNQALYVQEKGKKVKALGYSFANDQFAGTDLTALSWHLFNGYEIEEWAYQEEPFACVWAVRDDGKLLGLTYMPEHEVAGWHWHDTDGVFESVACVSEGDEDAVYAIVKRTIGGETKRYIERLASRFPTDYRDHFFVDSGLSYDGRNTTAKTMNLSGGTAYDHTETLTLTASAATFAAGDIGDEIHFRDEVNNRVYRLRITAFTSATIVSVIPNREIPAAYRNMPLTSWEFARNTFTGLDHLEGKTVSVLADGHVQPDQVVASGTISLEFPAAVVHAGLPIIADLETLDISVTGQSIRDKNKLINHVSFILEESSALWAGIDADSLLEHKQRTDATNYDEPVRPVSGTIDIRIQGTWNKQGRVFVRHIAPLPMSVLAIIPEVALGGS